MRAIGLVHTAILAGLAVSGCLCPPGIALPGLGIPSAQAGEVYTRKRVRGRWITGRFVRRSVAERAQYARASADAVDRPAEAQTALRREASDEPVGPSDAILPPARDDRLSQLQRALEARAHEIATTSSTTLPGVQGQGDAVGTHPPAEPRSVSFDFESGLKTTVYSDTVVVTEHFDIATLKGLASAPPRSGDATKRP